MDVRSVSMNKITALFDCSSGIIGIFNNTELNTQLLLDATHPDIERLLQPTLRQRKKKEKDSGEKYLTCLREGTSLSLHFSGVHGHWGQ